MVVWKRFVKHVGCTDDFILSLNNSLDKVGAILSPPLRRLVELSGLVSRHRDEISTALPNCGSTSTKVRFMTNLLRAEALFYMIGWASSNTSCSRSD